MIKVLLVQCRQQILNDAPRHEILKAVIRPHRFPSHWEKELEQEGEERPEEGRAGPGTEGGNGSEKGAGSVAERGATTRPGE